MNGVDVDGAEDDVEGFVEEFVEENVNNNVMDDIQNGIDDVVEDIDQEIEDNNVDLSAIDEIETNITVQDIIDFLLRKPRKPSRSQDRA